MADSPPCMVSVPEASQKAARRFDRDSRSWAALLFRQTCYLKSRTKPKLLDRMLIIEYGIERHVDLLLRGIRI